MVWFDAMGSCKRCCLGSRLAPTDEVALQEVFVREACLIFPERSAKSYLFDPAPSARDPRPQTVEEHDRKGTNLGPKRLGRS